MVTILHLTIYNTETGYIILMTLFPIKGSLGCQFAVGTSLPSLQPV